MATRTTNAWRRRITRGSLVLFIAIVTAALPVDIRAAVTHPSIGHAMFVAANAVVVALLVTMRRRQIARNAEESSA